MMDPCLKEEENNNKQILCLDLNTMGRELLAQTFKIDYDKIHELNLDEVAFTDEWLEILDDLFDKVVDKTIETSSIKNKEGVYITPTTSEVIIKNLYWIEEKESIFACICSDVCKDMIEVPKEKYRLIKNGTIH